MKKHIILHHEYLIREGFGTLMGHYAVMYCLYRDLGIIPVHYIPSPSISNPSVMVRFNAFDEPIIYHNMVFTNFDQIFFTIEPNEINNYNWKLKNFYGLSYKDILNQLQTNTNNVCIYWSLHSSLYEKYLNDILNDLYIFNSDIIERSKQVLPRTHKNLVGVCVRNEYKQANSPHPHTQLSIEFYKESMNQFDPNTTEYLIFSDDINETKIMFKNLEKDFDIVYTEPMQSAIGMCAMSLCDHNICANSSFSYWASILNKNSNKKIVCSPYFIDKNKDAQLANMINYKWYPQSWTTIDLA